jgi:hypothetical protein
MAALAYATNGREWYNSVNNGGEWAVNIISS